jgi:AraC-like DNA-binding protein
MAVEIVEIATTEPELARTTLDTIWGLERPMRISGDAHTFSCELRLASAEHLGSDRLHFGMVGHGSVAPAGFFSTLTVMSGACDKFGTAREVHRLPKGGVAMHPQRNELHYALSDTDAITIRLPQTAIDRVAQERLEADGAVRFGGLLPVSLAAALRWRQLSVFVNRELTSVDSLADKPLVEAQLADFVAATALTTFPNSALHSEEPPPRSYAASSAIRRAVSFIDANADQPITSTDIAEAAGISTRALQYGFARYYDTTPTAYLRRVRLERVHRDLQTTDPALGRTVEAIAARWGFGHGASFGSFYRTNYGESPSQTLRA